MPSPVRLAVVRKILESKGYWLDRISGSHHIFKKSGGRNIVIPVHGGKVAARYVRIAKEAP